MRHATPCQVDILLHNGIFITMDPSNPRAESLAIKGEHILWVGHQREMKQWIGPHTQVIDLQGAFVYPGFIDTHAHIFYTGMSKKCLPLKGIPDKQTLLERVHQYVKNYPKGEWIFAVGWEDDQWPDKEPPTAADLDEVAPDNPIVLERIDTHLICVNSCVLNMARIDEHTLDPIGGKIWRNSCGFPSGILMDRAMDFVKRIIPELSLKETIQLTQQILDECLQKGITMVHDATTMGLNCEAFRTLAKENKLPLRVYMMSTIESKDSILEHIPQSDNFLECRCLKFFMDGSLGSRGAALFEPYQDEPGNHGLLLWNECELLPFLQKAKEKGFQVATHAIGDRANHFILNAYEKIGVKGLRWRIEHAQLLSPSDIHRFADLQVIAAVQPLHAIVDSPWFEKRVGNSRTKEGAFVWRSLLDQGAIVVGGSDSPVVEMNPLWGIYAAVTRQDHWNLDKESWYPAQKVTPEEALKMYTIDAAYSCFREKDLGSLTAGKLADLVILPSNILTCPPKDLIDMKVLYTIVNGTIAYDSH